MLPLSMIVAIGNNGAIGYKGKIPWHISEDMSYFKKITQGHAIIMGRKTWNEIGKPLQEDVISFFQNNLCIKMWRFFLQLKMQFHQHVLQI